MEIVSLRSYDCTIVDYYCHLCTVNEHVNILENNQDKLFL